jgi:hypothetical protein
MLIYGLIETDGSKYTYVKLWQYFTGGESANTYISYKGRTYIRNRIMTSWDKILESFPQTTGQQSDPATLKNGMGQIEPHLS